jgi:hypothetical protein
MLAFCCGLETFLCIFTCGPMSQKSFIKQKLPSRIFHSLHATRNCLQLSAAPQTSPGPIAPTRDNSLSDNDDDDGGARLTTSHKRKTMTVPSSLPSSSSTGCLLNKTFNYPPSKPLSNAKNNQAKLQHRDKAGPRPGVSKDPEDAAAKPSKKSVAITANPTSIVKPDHGAARLERPLLSRSSSTTSSDTSSSTSSSSTFSCSSSSSSSPCSSSCRLTMKNLEKSAFVTEREQRRKATVRTTKALVTCSDDPSAEDNQPFDEASEPPPRTNSSSSSTTTTTGAIPKKRPSSRASNQDGPRPPRAPQANQKLQPGQNQNAPVQVANQGPSRDRVAETKTTPLSHRPPLAPVISTNNHLDEIIAIPLDDPSSPSARP